MIQNIDISKLQHHPLNPRKDYGDIEELAESIRINGILQNMTVVPAEDGMFNVVIGNRRLEAAKKAGLTVCACFVSEMDMETQVSTMMQENMLREALTVYEESKGFQTMLDMGATVEQVAEKSGFSQSTIRRRTKLSKLDEDKFKKAVDKGATLFELEKLYDIADEESRNEVLGKFGTKDYRNAVQKALDDQKMEAFKESAIKLCKDLGAVEAKSDYKDGRSVCIAADVEYPCKQIASMSLYIQKLPEKVETTGGKLFYTVGHSVMLYEEIGKDELSVEEVKRSENDLRREASSALLDQMKEINKRHQTMRDDFVKMFTHTKKFAPLIRKFAVNVLLGQATAQRYGSVDLEEIKNFIGEDIDINQAYNDQPDYLTLLIAYAIEGRCLNYGYDNWNSEYRVYTPIHKQNEKLDRIYSFLKSLGYEMSDEELQMADGTHPVFGLEWLDALHKEESAA